MKTSSFIILGAGFSYQADLPLANSIREYFVRNNVGQILKFGSGESKWVDFAGEADLNNGKIGFDHLAYGYILNTLVNRFVNERGTYTNYEDMYQFLLDNFKVKGFITSVLKEAKGECLRDKPELVNNPNEASYMYGFIHTNDDHLSSLINHLISDLLFWRIKSEEFVPKYAPFLSMLAKVENATITT